MADSPSNGSAPSWPPLRADLDEFEVLEMAHDSDGQLTWKRQALPDSLEAVRDWMSLRQRVESETRSAWPPAVPTSNDASMRSPEPPVANRRDPRPDDLLPTRLDMRGAPAVVLADVLPDLQWPGGPPAGRPLRSEGRWLGLEPGVHTRWADTASAGLPPPIRLTLAESVGATPAPVAVDAVIAPATLGPLPRRRSSNAERLALVATGVLIGAVITFVWSRPVERRTGLTRTLPATSRDLAVPAAALLASPSPRQSSTTDAGVHAIPDDTTGRPASIPGGGQPFQAAVTRTASLQSRPSSATAAPAFAAATGRPVANGTGIRIGTRRSPVAVAAVPPVRRNGRRLRPTPPVVPSRAAPPAALDVVHRYAVAYSRMDARATQALWPAADRRVLASTFNGLREQRLTLSGCRGHLLDVGATVSCRGTLRYRPRLGDHSTRTRRGEWRFALAPDGDHWRIDLVTER